MLMIHNALNFVIGNAAELRKAADDLDRINGSAIQSYLEKAGDKLSEEKLKEMLDAETWLSADEALQFGLCNVVLDANDMVASISEDLFVKYKNVPKALVKETGEPTGPSKEEMEQRQKIAEEVKQNSNYINDILGGI